LGPATRSQLGKRTLVVIGKRDDDSDQPPVLIVEDANARVDLRGREPGAYSEDTGTPLRPRTESDAWLKGL
jgi:hypothetical protein